MFALYAFRSLPYESASQASLGCVPIEGGYGFLRKGCGEGQGLGWELGLGLGLGQNIMFAVYALRETTLSEVIPGIVGLRADGG